MSLDRTQTGIAELFSALEPAISTGSTAQYYRGDKSWQTMGTQVVADTGWTANADGGDKTKVIPSSATLATLQTAMNLAVSGSGDALVAIAAKCKALETALVAAKLPNA